MQIYELKTTTEELFIFGEYDVYGALKCVKQ